MRGQEEDWHNKDWYHHLQYESDEVVCSFQARFSSEEAMRVRGLRLECVRSVSLNEGVDLRKLGDLIKEIDLRLGVVKKTSWIRLYSSHVLKINFKVWRLICPVLHTFRTEYKCLLFVVSHAEAICLLVFLQKIFVGIWQLLDFFF